MFLVAAAIAAVLSLGAGEASAQRIQNPNFTQPPAKDGYTYPDCYCTDSKGQRVEKGQKACLTIGSRRVLARCELSVNNPIWRPESEGCPGV
ncbi:MAG: hypothetical protein OEN23_17820 [Paracoccaceae bacterium]|nr:hypothetical protein [Paracoccaceae bacterium]